MTPDTSFDLAHATFALAIATFVIEHTDILGMDKPHTKLTIAFSRSLHFREVKTSLTRGTQVPQCHCSDVHCKWLYYRTEVA